MFLLEIFEEIVGVSPSQDVNLYFYPEARRCFSFFGVDDKSKQT